MGLIKAAFGATGGILADQWKEFFHCEAIPADVLVMKGQRNAGKRSSRGQKNTGKFCPNCGGKKPAGVPQYRCDKCGWQPADPTKAPRFCPECGDPFDNGDIV